MLKWWAQSFLVGIERVVVGFRDDDGTVRRLHAYPTKQLPKDQVTARREASALGASCTRASNELGGGGRMTDDRSSDYFFTHEIARDPLQL